MRRKIFLIIFGIIVVFIFGIGLFHNFFRTNINRFKIFDYFKTDISNNTKIKTDLVRNTIDNFLYAEENRNFREAEKFISSDFKKRFYIQKSLYKSNFRINHFNIFKTYFNSKSNIYEVSVRVWEGYAESEDIGYYDNIYYIKNFNGKYLIDNISYKNFININDKQNIFQTLPKNNNLCPAWVNCMPSVDIKKKCIVPSGCENYTQKVY